MSSSKWKDVIFYIAIMAFPVSQFCVFYLGVNFNSILLSFKSYDAETGTYFFSGLTNLKRVFSEFSQYQLTQATKNSFIAYAVNLLVGMPLTLLFSYYVYKKFFLSNFFKVVLFMPSIISSVAMVLIYKYFVENSIPALFGCEGLLSNPSTTFPTVMFYCIWFGFSGFLLYTGTMDGISDSVVEAAKLDGATPLQEFVKITFPMIYPTVVTFLVVGVAGIFVNQLNLFSFFGRAANIQDYTIGYYLYTETQNASLGEYPFLSAMGLLLTAIAVPLALLLRWLLEKFGPRTDK